MQPREAKLYASGGGAQGYRSLESLRTTALSVERVPLTAALQSISVNNMGEKSITI